MNMLQKIENQDQSIKLGDVTCYFSVLTFSMCGVMKKIQVPIPCHFKCVKIDMLFHFIIKASINVI